MTRITSAAPYARYCLTRMSKKYYYSPPNSVRVSARKVYFGICSSRRLTISTSGKSPPLHTSKIRKKNQSSTKEKDNKNLLILFSNESKKRRRDYSKNQIQCDA